MSKIRQLTKAAVIFLTITVAGCSDADSHIPRGMTIKDPFNTYFGNEIKQYNARVSNLKVTGHEDFTNQRAVYYEFDLTYPQGRIPVASDGTAACSWDPKLDPELVRYKIEMNIGPNPNDRITVEGDTREEVEKAWEARVESRLNEWLGEGLCDDPPQEYDYSDPKSKKSDAYFGLCQNRGDGELYGRLHGLFIPADIHDFTVKKFIDTSLHAWLERQEERNKRFEEEEKKGTRVEYYYRTTRSEPTDCWRNGWRCTTHIKPRCDGSDPKGDYAFQRENAAYQARHGEAIPSQDLRSTAIRPGESRRIEATAYISFATHRGQPNVHWE